MLPHARAGPSFQEEMLSGKFHGTMRPTTPSGSRKVRSIAAGDGDRLAVPLVDRAGVEVEDVGDHADLAAGAADRLADVVGLDPRELFVVLFDEGREPPQQPSPVGGRNRPPSRESARSAAATAASVSSTPADSRVAMVSSVAGLMTVTVTLAI